MGNRLENRMSIRIVLADIDFRDRLEHLHDFLQNPIPLFLSVL